MAGESKEILELSKHLIPVFNEIRNAARTMAEASEKLSNTGLDKFAEQVKKTLKQQQLINDADLEYLKDAKSIQKVLHKLESQYEALHKLEKEAERIAKASLGAAKVDAATQERALKAARENIQAKYEEHDITLDMVDAIKQGVPILRAETEQRLKNIGAGDKLSRSFEELTGSVKNQISGLVGFTAALGFAKKSIFGYYDQMNRLTARGMLGALHTIQRESVKLSISR
jgi:hypothetical protein